jgi:hypothetical protein
MEISSLIYEFPLYYFHATYYLWKLRDTYIGFSTASCSTASISSNFLPVTIILSSGKKEKKLQPHLVSREGA